MLRELFERDRLAETIEENEKKFKKLVERAQDLKAQEDLHFQQLGMSREQIIELFNNPENFSEEEWAAIQAQIADYDVKIAQYTSQHRDRAKMRKNYGERADIRPHWLFVR